MFWTKVECDGCNAKIKPRGAIYHRGSYFCNATCRDTWERANPPRVAHGDPAQLKHTLISTIDAAFDELGRATAGPTVGQVAAQLVPVVGKYQSGYQAQDRAEQMARFREYTHECVPIVRALGYADEVVVLERFGFGAQPGEVIAALRRARARAAMQ
jgi:hypothetical protein